MIRPVTCLCMMFAAGSGLYLYQAKHRSQLLDQDIAKILNAADANRDRMRVLRAEYQLLQDPNRMSDLAAQHLALAKTDPKQFVNWATLERSVPVVIAPPPAAEPPPAELGVPVASLTGPTAPPPGTTVTASLVPPPGAKAESVPAAVRAGPPAPVSAAPTARVATPVAATQHPAAPSPTLMASAATPMARSSLGMARPDSSAAAFAPPRVPPAPAMPQSVMMTTPRRYAYQPQSMQNSDAAARLGRSGTIEPAVPMVASALGMARTMSDRPYFPTNSTGWTPNGGG